MSRLLFETSREQDRKLYTSCLQHQLSASEKSQQKKRRHGKLAPAISARSRVAGLTCRWTLWGGERYQQGWLGGWFGVGRRASCRVSGKEGRVCVVARGCPAKKEKRSSTYCRDYGSQTVQTKNVTVKHSPTTKYATMNENIRTVYISKLRFNFSYISTQSVTRTRSFWARRCLF